MGKYMLQNQGQWDAGCSFPSTTGFSEGSGPSLHLPSDPKLVMSHNSLLSQNRLRWYPNPQHAEMLTGIPRGLIWSRSKVAIVAGALFTVAVQGGLFHLKWQLSAASETFSGHSSKEAEISECRWASGIQTRAILKSEPNAVQNWAKTFGNFVTCPVPGKKYPEVLQVSGLGNG